MQPFEPHRPATLDEVLAVLGYSCSLKVLASELTPPHAAPGRRVAPPSAQPSAAAARACLPQTSGSAPCSLVLGRGAALQHRW